MLIEVWEVMRSKFFARLYERHGDDGNTTKTKFARDAEATEAARQQLYKISPLSNFSTSVLNNKNQKMYHVDLQRNTCTCTHFQDMRIPCRHAIAAAERLKVPRYSDSRYTIEEHRKAYSGGFCFIAQQDLMPSPSILPPDYTRRVGRRKNRRIRREDLSKQKQPRRCGNCRMIGHNTRTCNGVIDEQPEDNNAANVTDAHLQLREKQLEERRLKRAEKEIEIAMRKQALREAGRDSDDEDFDDTDGDEDPDDEDTDDEYAASVSSTPPPRTPSQRRQKSRNSGSKHNHDRALPSTHSLSAPINITRLLI